MPRSLKYPFTHYVSPLDLLAVFRHRVLAASGLLAITVGLNIEAARAATEIDNNDVKIVSGTDVPDTWTINDTLVVGNSGKGTLQIENGGKVDVNGSLYIGNATGSVGFVTLTEGGGNLTVSEALLVGESGKGTLNIGAGSTVISGESLEYTTLGHRAGSEGTAKVEGIGANWTINSRLLVGSFGKGTLTIGPGGTVNNTIGFIGSSAGSIGTVSVAGKNAVWNSSQALEVGGYGTGSLNIGADGLVTTGLNGNIGFYAGSNGSVEISGQNARWNVAGGTVNVGSSGAGALVINNGGTLNAGMNGQGVLRVGVSTGSGALSVGAASIDPNAARDVGLINAAQVQLGSNGSLNFNHSNTNYQFLPTLSGDGSLYHYAGKTTLAGDNTNFLGTAHVKGGSLELSNTFNGNATVASGGVLTVNSVFAGSATVADGGTLNGTGVFTKAGPNAVTVQNGGTLAIGTLPGTLTLSSLTLEPGSNTVFKLNTPGVLGLSDAVTGNDLITISNTTANSINLGGTLHAQVAAAGYYRLFDYAPNGDANLVSGAFTNTVLHSSNLDFTPANAFVQTQIAGQINLAVLGVGQNLQFWDGSDLDASDGIVTGGAGIWRSNSTNWTGLPGQAQINGSWLGSVGVFAGETAGTVVNADIQSFDTLQFSVDGYTLSGAALAFGPAQGNTGTVQVDSGVSATIDSNLIDGSATSLQKLGSGTLILGGNNTYSGGTTIHNGIVSVMSDSALGQAAGGITLNGGTLQIRDTGYTSTNRYLTIDAAGGGIDIAAANHLFTLQQGLDGTGVFTKLGAGTLVLSQAGNFRGATALQNGTLRLQGSGALLGDAVYVGDNATLDASAYQDSILTLGPLSGAGAIYLGSTSLRLGETNQDELFSGTIHDGGWFGGTAASLIKRGTGTLTLNGQHTYTGLTEVNAGTLIVGDTQNTQASLAGSVAINSGGTLAGVGTVGSTTVSQGGSLASRSATGALTVNGNLAFTAGSTYAVDTLATNAGSDMVIATGNVHIQDGAVFQLNAISNFAPDTFYTVLRGQHVDGRFDAMNSSLTFLAPTLDYNDPQTVVLRFQRNSTRFADLANTRNQGASAKGIESLGQGHTLYDAVVTMNDAYADIARAYDLLSGEIHASTKTALIQDSRFVRDAAMTRLRNQADPATSLQSSVRTQTLGSWNDTQSDGNAAGITHRTHGLLVGGDKALGDWHIGALGGYSYSNIDTHARQSNSRSNSLHLGVYAGRQWERWALRTGAAYSHHDIKTRRSAEVNGYTDRLSANYQAGVLQTYAELGYSLQAGPVLLEPFGNLAYTHLRTDGFHEQGEAAALQSHNQSDDNVFSVLGLRTSVPLTVGKASAQFHATLGWQHAYGTVRPTATHAFKGGDPFTVQAAPLARDGALLTAGLDVELTDTSRLGVGYQGQFGSGLEQHGVKVDFRWRF